MMSLLQVGMTAASPPGIHAPDPRLAKAAHEFEAQLMKELFEPLTRPGGLSGDEDGDGAGETGTLGEFAGESLARSLSDHGGLGIARQILGDLSRSGNTAGNSPVTEKTPVDNVMYPNK